MCAEAFAAGVADDWTVAEVRVGNAVLTDDDEYRRFRSRYSGSDHLLRVMTAHPGLTEHVPMAVRKISPIGTHRTFEASSTRLVDEMLRRYVSWREHATAVADAYRQWSAAPADEEVDGFSAYLAALDFEEASAKSYAVLVAEVERSLNRGRGQST